ncbi:MAG TPA: uroporphyrinogen-III synthase, partial [Candidatus Acidoferrales bacterium]|nr:uroporphyrinogen-III synthase [Candidatus Acidoferrales bacterium]
MITRAPEQSSVLLRELEGSGATVILLPFVEFRLPRDTGPLDSALARLSQFDWLVFTSPNGARFFCQRLRELGREPSELLAPLPLVAAIGVATASAATKQGLAVEFALADVRSGSEFAHRFSSAAIHGKKILLPQSDLADGHIRNALKESEAVVTEVVAYRTCMPESLHGQELEQVRRDGADVFVFASPSAFRNFAKTVGPEELRRFADHSAFAAIGPTTAEAIRGAGVLVKIEAAKP